MLLRDRDDGEARGILGKLNGAGITIDQIKYGYDVFYRRAAYSSIVAACPNAESMTNRLIQFPVHPGLTVEDLQRAVSILRTVGI